MGKKVKESVITREEYEDEQDDKVSIDSDEQIAAIDAEQNEEEVEKKFGQKAINDEENLKLRLGEIQKNFYNRLESAKLVKKQGRVPFTEHLTLTHKDPVSIPTELAAVNDDIKRELAFYNTTRDNVMQGMKFLIQAQVPISRPDDFLAEMLKTDDHMRSVKSRLLKQQVRIQTFEEKKQRLENKKFHKAIKDYKMKQKHQDKRENNEQIKNFKDNLRAGKADLDSAFDRAHTTKGAGKKGTPTFGAKKREKVIDIVRGQHQVKRQNQFKDKNAQTTKKGPARGRAGPKKVQKRPGKVARQAKGTAAHKRR